MHINRDISSESDLILVITNQLYSSDNQIYQLPHILTALLHIARKTLSISRHVPLSGHDEVALFEWGR